MTWQQLPQHVQDAATATLTPKQLAVVKARLNHHSWRTIALANGIHESTARGHWTAALDRLTPQLTDQITKAAT